MPRGKVGQVRRDHLIRVCKLGLGQAGAGQIGALQPRDKVPPVAPGVEVAAVLAEHFGRQAELLLPHAPGEGDGQAGDGLLEDPLAVGPDPVAFGGFEEEGDGEGELGLDC